MWGHYQWISKLLAQMALCKDVYGNGPQIVKLKFKFDYKLIPQPLVFFLGLIDKIESVLQMIFDSRK